MRNLVRLGFFVLGCTTLAGCSLFGSGTEEGLFYGAGTGAVSGASSAVLSGGGGEAILTGAGQGAGRGAGQVVSGQAQQAVLGQVGSAGVDPSAVTQGVPQPTVPSVSVPSATVPSVNVPSADVPGVSVESPSVPSVSMPSASVPSVDVPHVSGDVASAGAAVGGMVGGGSNGGAVGASQTVSPSSAPEPVGRRAPERVVPSPPPASGEDMVVSERFEPARPAAPIDSSPKQSVKASEGLIGRDGTLHEASRPSQPETAPEPRRAETRRWTLACDDLFRSGSGQLTPQGRQRVQDVARVIETDSGVIEVVGHTDGRGSAAGNIALSEARASAVRQELIRAGFTPSSVRSKGLGATSPAASNQTPSGRRQNRRVEIIVHTEASTWQSGARARGRQTVTLR